jgi:hypothetical protein
VQRVEEAVLSDSKKLFQNPPPPPLQKPFSRQRGFKLRLPRRLVIASTPSVNSLSLKVQLETTDTAETISVDALVDSGATGLFIDSEFVKKHRLTTRALSTHIPVFNVDGTANENGAISAVVDIVLRYKDHSERTQFAVTSLGRQSMILGYTWLKEHNPEVNWQTGEVKMSRCPSKCAHCLQLQREERRAAKVSAARINLCRVGPRPSWVEELDDDEEDEYIQADLDMKMPDLADVELEEGDRLFATWEAPPAENICATGSTSQRLAEAFAKNSAKAELIPEYLREFSAVFSKESFDELPQRRIWDHAIELVPDAVPSSCKVYPLSPNEQAELDKFLDENLKSGRIRPSKSPMASPVFFIKKKDGSLRLVQDYRVLNSLTIKNRYPIPLISGLINQLKGSRYFSKMDVRWGYNNVRIKEGDEWKAAFRTSRGLFEPLVMFFGLTNSPSTFQTLMNDIFHELISEGSVVVYMDDILVHTETLEQHRQVLKQVMEILKENRLYLRPEKCEFEKTKIEFLGLIIGHNTVEMDPVKVAGVADWPAPHNRREVQAFLGFVNFYRRFIAEFSHHARPLFDLTKKDVAWKWGPEAQAAFDELKRIVTSAPVFCAPDDARPFRVEADSSDFATGAVLSQESLIDG